MIEMGSDSNSKSDPVSKQKENELELEHITTTTTVQRRKSELELEPMVKQQHPPSLQMEHDEESKEPKLNSNQKISSPASMSNTAQITESVIIITPKAQLAQPPSIEKQQLTLNLIGVTENGQIAVSRQNTIEIIMKVLSHSSIQWIDSMMAMIAIMS